MLTKKNVVTAIAAVILTVLAYMAGGRRTQPPTGSASVSEKKFGALPIGSPLAGVYTCGTTTTCAGTAVAGGTIVKGTVALSTGAATVASISPAFTSTSTFNCVTGDTTDATKTSNAVPASASSITVTGTGSDVISYVCVGN